MAKRGRFFDTQATPQNLYAIWDQIHQLGTDLIAAKATITTQASTIADLQSQLTNAQRTAAHALMIAGQPNTTVTATGTPTPAPGSNNTDNGQGELGCSTAPATGHVSDPASLVVLGQIVCGTGAEFPALLAVTANQADRDTNRAELIGRMIWHINLNGGFRGVARYPGNPFDILVTLGTTQYAYRVTGYETFDQPMTTVMVYGGQTANTATTPDPGISD